MSDPREIIKPETVVLASRVPRGFKAKVKKFADSTRRTESQAIHYLIETNPEFQKTIGNESVNQTGNSEQIVAVKA